MSIKVSAKGKELIRECIQRQLEDEVRSGVPREGTIHMLTYWVVGLLENQTEELKKQLEEP